ncbi:MAG: RNA polymerase factor sigma-54, partial [Methylophilaceae bacterium]
MRQGFQLKFSQHLALTPQLQQSIRLLQLSSQELNQEIETLLQENPLLERGEASETETQAGHTQDDQQYSEEQFTPADNSSESEFNDPLLDDYYNQQQRWEESSYLDEDNDFQFQEADTPTLREHLIQQIRLMPLSLHDQRLALYLIDAINEDGYLEQSLAELVEQLPAELE